MNEKQQAATDLMATMTNTFSKPPAHPTLEAPFEGDQFGFARLIPPLTRMLSRTREPLVVAVTADYGQGKSTFLKMWQAHLKADGANCLYFDAWQTDFIHPPLAALLGEINDQMRGQSGGALRALKSAGAKVVAKIAPPAIRIGVEAGTTALGTAVGGLPGGVAAGPAGKALGTSAEKAAAEYMKARQDAKKTLAAFREALAKYAKDSAGSKDGAASAHGMPVVFFIDELDRCRPDYAVEMLETVKHLFDVPGVVFVLGITRKSLSASIKSLYGNLNADAYLRRFIDLFYNLPPPPLSHYCELMSNDTLSDVGTLKSADFYRDFDPKGDYPRSWVRLFARALGSLSPAFKCGARDIQQVVARARAGVRSLPEGEFAEPVLLAYLLLWQHQDEEGYLKVRMRGELLFPDVEGQKQSPSLLDGLDALLREALWMLVSSAKTRQQRLNGLSLESIEVVGSREWLADGMNRTGPTPFRNAAELADLTLQFSLEAPRAG